MDVFYMLAIFTLGDFRLTKFALHLFGMDFLHVFVSLRRMIERQITVQTKMAETLPHLSDSSMPDHVLVDLVHHFGFILAQFTSERVMIRMIRVIFKREYFDAIPFEIVVFAVADGETPFVFRRFFVLRRVESFFFGRAFRVFSLDLHNFLFFFI